MLWALQESGHSLLITTGEETGCHGAKAAAKALKKELPEHAYALEVDRRGDRQAVFYDVGTEAFEAYMLDLLSKSDPEAIDWVQEQGSTTDIRSICPEALICGVNVSAGYNNEHSGSEHLYLEAWLHTYGTLAKALKLEQRRFVLPKKVAPKYQGHAFGAPYGGAYGLMWCYIHAVYSDRCPVSQNPECAAVRKLKMSKEGSANPTEGSEKGPFKLVIYRMGVGVDGPGKAGIGKVVLRMQDVDGKLVPLRKISKRQCKKFGKYVQAMMFKKSLNHAEASEVLAAAIQLRDGPIPTVTQEQREEHAAGATDAFVKGMQESSKPRGLAQFVQAQPGEFVPHKHKAGGNCWHYCRLCDRQWYHERRQEVLCRPNYFCCCPICSPEVVPRLIVDDAEPYKAATWGYEARSKNTNNAPQPKPDPLRVPVLANTPEKDRRLNSPDVCQHYCARCSGPWRHMRPPITRSGVLCGVGAYDHDCPMHSHLAAKIVMLYEEQLHIKTGGWTETLHKPPPEKPATGNEPHGAAPAKSSDQLLLPGTGTAQDKISGGGGVVH